jgi:hypothetical protein
MPLHGRTSREDALPFDEPASALPSRCYVVMSGGSLLREDGLTFAPYEDAGHVWATFTSYVAARRAASRFFGGATPVWLD